MRLHVLGLAVTDIGWIAHNDIPLPGIGSTANRQHVALFEADLHPQPTRILLRNAKGNGRHIPCRDLRFGPVLRQRTSYASAARTDVKHAGSCARLALFCPLAQLVGLRSWNQHARGYMKLPRTEVGQSRHILHRLTFGQPFHHDSQTLLPGNRQSLDRPAHNIGHRQRETRFQNVAHHGTGLARIVMPQQLVPQLFVFHFLPNFC